jgi:hypothetical protein
MFDREVLFLFLLLSLIMEEKFSSLPFGSHVEDERNIGKLLCWLKININIDKIRIVDDDDVER